MKKEKKLMRFKKVVKKAEENDASINGLSFINLINTSLLAFFLGGIFLYYKILDINFYILFGFFPFLSSAFAIYLYHTDKEQDKIYYEEIRENDY